MNNFSVNLLERLSINLRGELHLSAPASHGRHEFKITATTLITEEFATTVVCYVYYLKAEQNSGTIKLLIEIIYSC